MASIKKKYGFWSGIAMVVGVVVGAGIFIKSSAVLEATAGDVSIALLAWLVGGFIMITSGFCFAKYATRISKFNGLVDYVEIATNKRFAYYVAYFSAMLYFPIIGVNVALISASYIVELFGINPMGDLFYLVYIIAFVLITVFVFLNYLAPRISNKFQISVTIIKVIPIIIIAIACLFGPLIVGRSIIDPFIDKPIEGQVVNFGEAVKITAFAYDGWICATAINSEMKNPKRDLPRALVGGTVAVLLFYVLYFIGVSVLIKNKEFIDAGPNAPILAFMVLFGEVGGKIFIVFIALSCLGNLNAMEICSSRGFLAMAVRDQGFFPKRMKKNNGERFGFAPHLLAYIMMIIFLVLTLIVKNTDSFLHYLTSMDDMVCAIIYIVYICIYVYMIRRFKDLDVLSRYVMPILAIAGSIFFAFCGTGLYQLIANHDVNSLIAFGIFLALTTIIFIPAEILWHVNNKKIKAVRSK